MKMLSFLRQYFILFVELKFEWMRERERERERESIRGMGLEGIVLGEGGVHV
mgnify:CR=1 FL=1